MKCLFITDNDGNENMEVYGHPRALEFVQEGQLAAKFFAYVNSKGIFNIV